MTTLLSRLSLPWTCRMNLAFFYSPLFFSSPNMSDIQSSYGRTRLSIVSKRATLLIVSRSSFISSSSSVYEFCSHMLFRENPTFTFATFYVRKRKIIEIFLDVNDYCFELFKRQRCSSQRLLKSFLYILEKALVYASSPRRLR